MNILFAAKEVTITDSLMIAGIGIGIVLAVLVMLVGFLYLLKYVFVLLQKIENKWNAWKIARKNRKQTTVSPNAEPDVPENELNDELISVITAAITAAYQSENTVVPPFKIRTIKKN